MAGAHSFQFGRVRDTVENSKPRKIGSVRFPACSLQIVPIQKTDIIYGTDPGMERAMEEQAREEKEKEDKAWKMLQHMNLYNDSGKNPRSTKQGSTQAGSSQQIWPAKQRATK